MVQTIIILGSQWGDEGKGKFVDYLAEKSDMVVRFAGGNNAGHTVVVGEEVYKLHLIPSGIVHQDKINIIGNGTVIDPEVLLKEIEGVESRDISVTNNNLLISQFAHVITPEQIEEDKAKGGKIGTTGRGIGPCYRDKISRTGKRIIDFVKEDSSTAKRLSPLVADTPLIVNNAIAEGKKILFEGAQGTLLDIDHGTYPFVTSSNCTAGGACTGAGVGPTKIDKVHAILKAYVTRVGRGPFPTELGTDEDTINEDADAKLTEEDIQKANDGDEYTAGYVLRKQGFEYGTTTGRARRTGWLDTVIARYAVKINGLDSFILTKLDVLQNIKKIKICTHYEIDGKKVEDFPADLESLEKCKPVYEEVDGFDEDITGVTKYDDLPDTVKAYLKRIEELVGCPISIVSVGPKRSQTMILRPEEFF